MAAVCVRVGGFTCGSSLFGPKWTLADTGQPSAMVRRPPPPGVRPVPLRSHQPWPWPLINLRRRDWPGDPVGSHCEGRSELVQCWPMAKWELESERHTVTSSHVLKQERHTPTAANESESTRTHARTHAHTQNCTTRNEVARAPQRSRGPRGRRRPTAGACATKMTRTLFPPHSERSGNAFWPPAFGTFPERPERGPPGDLEARARSRRGTVCTSQMNNNK